MTDLEIRLYTALKRITCYDAPDKLRRRAQRDYGLSGDEAIEYAYENVLQEARNGLKGIRLPRAKKTAPKSASAVESTQRVERPLSGRCAAARDGDCSHSQCPQLRDGEPVRSGRHCPLDVHEEDI